MKDTLFFIELESSSYNCTTVVNNNDSLNRCLNSINGLLDVLCHSILKLYKS